MLVGYGLHGGQPIHGIAGRRVFVGLSPQQEHGRTTEGGVLGPIRLVFSRRPLFLGGQTQHVVVPIQRLIILTPTERPLTFVGKPAQPIPAIQWGIG